MPEPLPTSPDFFDILDAREALADFYGLEQRPDDDTIADLLPLMTAVDLLRLLIIARRAGSRAVAADLRRAITTWE